MEKYLTFAGHGDANHGHEDLCIVLDTSYSMDDGDYEPTRLEGAKTAARALLEIKRDQYPLDRAAIIGFSGSARRIHQLMRVAPGFQSLVDALEDVETTGSTNITSGLWLAGRTLSMKVPLSINIMREWLSSLVPMPQPEAGRSRILLLSDGCDTTMTDPTCIAQTLKDQGVVIDVIGIGGPDREHLDEDQLKRIASLHSDGSPRYCFIDDTEELIRTFQTLAHHIKVMGCEELG